MTQTQKWPEKMTKTREEMIALGLPCGGTARVVQDTITDEGRYVAARDLIFQLPDMPDDLAYRTSYRTYSVDRGDEAPWEYEPADCTLVRRVPKVVDDWTDAPVTESSLNAIMRVPMSAARQIRNDIYRDCDAERERQISKGYDAAHDDDRADGEISGIAAAVAAQDARVARPMLWEAAQHILDKWPRYADRIRIAHAMLTADLERLARANGQPKPRIELAQIDPDTLVGIAPANNGSPGWVVLALKSDGTSDMIEPLGDGYNGIVYTDILDAAEVLRTGIVWKHDMGEETVDDPDSGPLDVEPAPAPAPARVRDERGRIEYTATYRLRETGEQVVTRFWSFPDRTRDHLIGAVRQTVIRVAAEQGRNLDWRVVQASIDPDSYVFDPPASDMDAGPLATDRSFEVRFMAGTKNIYPVMLFADATRVTDAQGFVIKDRNPGGPACNVVVEIGPSRGEFLVRRAPTPDVAWDTTSLRLFLTRFLEVSGRMSSNRGATPPGPAT